MPPTPPGELYRILFESDWTSAAETAGEQLREWAAAFDAWLAHDEAVGGRRRRMSDRYAWQDFWNTMHRLPWQVEPADLACWMADLERRGRSPVTIHNRIGQIEQFYKFYAAQKDPAAGVPSAAPPGSASSQVLDPVLGVRRPRIKKNTATEVMSLEDVHALLAAVDRDVSVIGKRDYAMILAGLVTAKDSGKIRTLRWGDLPGFIDEVPGAAGRESTRTLHRAIEDYLRAAGRWETIAPADYVFAPSADPLNKVPGGQAGDWVSGRPLSDNMVAHLLKRYACWAGLDGDRVTWHTVRNTAALLRLESGDSAEALQVFLGHLHLKHTLTYIQALAGRQNTPLRLRGLKGGQPLSPIKKWERKPRGLPKAQPGNTNRLKHGFRSKRPALKDLVAQVDPSEKSLQWETRTLRAVLRRAADLFQDAGTAKEWLAMLDGFGIATQRLANLLRAESALRKSAREMGKEDTIAAIQAAMDQVAKEIELEEMDLDSD